MRVPSEQERQAARKALEDCEMVGRPLSSDEARIIGWTLRCLESEWGAADESCVLAGVEKPDLDESLWMHPDYPPLYPRINQLHVQKVALEDVLRAIEKPPSGTWRNLYERARRIASEVLYG